MKGAAISYESWASEAQAADESTGASLWRDREASNLYDYKIVRRRLDELRDIRATQDAQRLLYFFKEGIHGNAAGMGEPKLYARAKFGTKRLITEYVDELVQALESLDRSEDIPEDEKLVLFRRASMGFGRTALMLSGAGSLGAFHLGVVKTLHEQQLLPRVISGASTGAFVAAILGTHTSQELQALLHDDSLIERIAFQVPNSGRRAVDHHDLEVLMRNFVPDLTFEEAYETSGLHINISVAATKSQQRSRLLNATTAPNAMIREAVMASCAIPGRFPAVTLAAKDHEGKRQPYIPSRSWIDGSVTDELPARRLTRLYGTNYFIGSTANPMITTLPDIFANSPWSPWAQLQESIARQWLRTVFPMVEKQLKQNPVLNVPVRNWFSMVTQEYKADINILPKARYFRPGSLFETLTIEETESLLAEGELATYPFIERLKVTTAVSSQIDRMLLDRGEDSLLP